MSDVLDSIIISLQIKTGHKMTQILFASLFGGYGEDNPDSDDDIRSNITESRCSWIWWTKITNDPIVAIKGARILDLGDQLMKKEQFTLTMIANKMEMYTSNKIIMFGCVDLS